MSDKKEQFEAAAICFILGSIMSAHCTLVALKNENGNVNVPTNSLEELMINTSDMIRLLCSFINIDSSKLKDSKFTLPLFGMGLENSLVGCVFSVKECLENAKTEEETMFFEDITKRMNAISSQISEANRLILDYVQK